MVVLNPDILPDIRMSVDEYLSAQLPEGFRYELVDGVIEVSPVPDVPHDVVVERVHSKFAAYKGIHPEIVAHVTQKAAVTLVNKRTTREPDFAVYGPLDMGDWRGKSWQKMAPLLVMEVVSIGQEGRDYEDKRIDYWEARVSEYWIADPKRHTLTVLTRGTTDWIERLYEAGEIFKPAQFPGLEIKVSELFA